MKKMYVEDRERMEWNAVCYVNKSGVPMFDLNGSKLRDEDIQRCVNWCNAHGYNWMVTEILHN